MPVCVFSLLGVFLEFVFGLALSAVVLYFGSGWVVGVRIVGAVLGCPVVG